MTTNHKCDHFKMSYWVISECTSHKPAFGCPYFSNVEQESVVQADSMSPSPPQTVVNLSTEALLSVICWCQLTIRGSAVRWSKAKRSGRSPLHTLFHRTALFTHTGHSRWGDTCHSCTVRSEGCPDKPPHAEFSQRTPRQMQSSLSYSAIQNWKFEMLSF